MALKSHLRRQCCVKKSYVIYEFLLGGMVYTFLEYFKQLNHTWINIETIQNIFDLLTFPSLACNATEKSHPFFILFFEKLNNFLGSTLYGNRDPGISSTPSLSSS